MSSRIIKIAFTLLFALSCSPYLASAEGMTRTLEANGFQYRIGPHEEWIEDHSYKTPEEASDEPVNYLLIDDQIQFKSGNADYFMRSVSLPQTTAGLEQASTITVNFNPAYQQLTWHRVAIIRDGHEIDRLTPSAITLMQREEDLGRDIIDGSVTAMLVIGGSRKGDIIDYSFTLSGRNPIFGEHVFYHSRMGWQATVNSLHARVVFVGNEKIHYQAHRFDQQPVIIQQPGKTEYLWHIKDTPRVVVENDTPPWYRAFPEVSFSSFERWEDVGNWAAPLYRERTITHPDLRDFIARLKPLSREQQVSQALAFAQGEIRYLGIELGESSHKPNLPDTVYEHRYGDCKDKTLLLVALLEALGISAFPALVSSYGGMNLTSALPSPAEFNHVITRVELDHKVYWLDPTNTIQHGSLDNLGYVGYDFALVVGHPFMNLVAMPIAPEVLPEIHTSEVFNIVSYEAPVDYRIVTTYSGIEAEYMRAKISRQGLPSLERDFLNYMTRLYPRLERAAPLSMVSDRELNRVILTENYRLNDYFRRAPEMLIADIYAFSIADYLVLPQTVKRNGPLRYFNPKKVTHETKIRYPEYLAISLANDTPKIDTPGFSLSYTEDYRDRMIIATYEYHAKSAFLAAEQVEQHLLSVRQANELLSASFNAGYPETSKAAHLPLAKLVARLNTRQAHGQEDRP